MFVLVKKNCSQVCVQVLIIDHNGDKFILHTDLGIEYDGYKYTVLQTKKIEAQLSQQFSIRHIGDALVFVSNRYGFWVIWNQQGNSKIGVSQKLIGKVDGLCGYYSGNPEDDKRKPDGTVAKNTMEFGDSWARDARKESCEAKVCPAHVQKKAWEICNKVT